MILWSKRQKRAPFGWFSISSWKKNSLNRNFPQLGATETILGISFLSLRSPSPIMVIFQRYGKIALFILKRQVRFKRTFLALIRKVFCKPKIQWGKFVRSQFLFKPVLTFMSSVSDLFCSELQFSANSAATFELYCGDFSRNSVLLFFACLNSSFDTVTFCSLFSEKG